MPTGSGYSLNSSVVVCDIDGKKVILTSAKSASSSMIYAIRTDTYNSLVTGWTTQTIKSSTLSLSQEIAVGDLNHDGKLKIVVIGVDTVYVLSNSGTLLHKAYIKDLTPYVTPVIADIDGDSDDEIIFSSILGQNKNVFALKPNLDKVLGFPVRTTFGSGYSTPCVADIDNDGKNELIVADDGWIHIWKTNGKAGNVEWGSERHDQYNTGEYQKTCAPINISANETWNTDHSFCSDLVVKSGTLTINSGATVTMGNSTTITINSGASLVIDSATLANANVHAMGGSSVTIKNNGSIKLRTNGDFNSEAGALLDMPYGGIGQ